MRTLRLLLATAMTTIALAAVAAAPASAAPSWTLVDYHQTACFSPHVTSSWYGIWISGRWRHSIDVGARRLPGGRRLLGKLRADPARIEHRRVLACLRARRHPGDYAGRQLHGDALGVRRHPHAAGSGHAERDDALRVLTQGDTLGRMRLFRRKRR